MAALPFDLPGTVLEWIRGVFAEVNHRAAATLSRIPTTFETTLDHGLIAHLAEFGAPFKFQSEWIVTLDTHYLGGGRYWGNWEVADIGILVVFRKRGAIIGTKIALLQSKRLYPDELEVPSDRHAVDYRVGFGRLLTSDSEYQSHVKPRQFTFTRDSRYRALEYKEDQYEAILKYTVDHGIPVHYLLYHPLDIPFSTMLPATAASRPDDGNLCVGCRILNSTTLDAKAKAAKLKKAANPTFVQLAGADTLAPDFWSLEHFVADLVIGCKEGHRAGTNPLEDEGLFLVFNRRGGPISAAISITIDSPNGV